MSAASSPAEQRIAHWRSFVSRGRSIAHDDVDELEDHLRHQIDALEQSGLSDDEAFLVAVRRLGRVDDLSREFGREHADRLWKQLVAGDEATPQPRRHTLAVAVVAAIAAALWVTAPTLFGLTPWDTPEIMVPALPVLYLAPLAAYLLIRRGARATTTVGTLLPFVLVGALLAWYPFDAFGMTHVLAIAHAAVVLWLAVGFAYADGDARSGPARMNLIRFTGEWIVYVALILVGGVVLTAIAVGAFATVGVSALEPAVEWIAPAGTAAAFVIGAWLVEEKQSVIENIVPVLTRLFTPLFTIVLLALVAAAVVQNDLIDGSRELLIVFDVVLVATLALLLYTMSARDPDARPGWFEGTQLAMIAAALIVDLIVLAAMLGRIGEYGLSANKLASLGVNLVLFANLAGAGWLQLGFLRGRERFSALESWQTSYVPVYLAWAAVVVVVFPPVFAFA
ncbi:permease prefix domain 1-containing protein [Microbacterium sp. No. 7]|uniref:permease prefix domain 1-containing protein n=1 Tax=Microbacterium sp. No. 7 TaxID=1714373 RepID=UPI0006D085A9|nr:permease prefix domain 1-containing protein [Microbacterium sp. No. 7]ALJ19941.1 hypothetical protein AOA12_08480 [Microbacterium sp. No. 7]